MDFCFQTIIFKDLESLQKESILHPGGTSVGTLAFLNEQQELLIRVTNGWKYVTVSKATVTGNIASFLVLNQLGSFIQISGMRSNMVNFIRIKFLPLLVI